VPRWKRNLYAIWMCQILSMMGFGFVLPFLPFYIQTLGVTDPAALRAWTGAISGAPGVLMGIIAPVWGTLADRHGRRLMLLRAMGAGAIGMAAMAFAPNVQVVFALRLIQGLFAGTIAAASTLVAAGTPRENISYAMGFIASAAFIGNALGPSIGGLCAEWLGYRTTFFIGAAITATGFFLVLAFVEEVHEERDEGISADRGIPFNVRLTWKLPFLPMFIAFFVLRLARNLPGPFTSLYIQELRGGTIQGSSALTGALSAVIGVLTAVSGMMLTRLGDRHDKLRLLTVFLAFSAATALPIFFVPGSWGFVGFYILSVVFLGPTNPLLESTMTVLTSRATRGVLFGVEAFMGSMAMALAPFLGSVVTIAFTLKHIFLAYGIALVFALAVAAVSRRAAARAPVYGAVAVSSAAR
jgi:DHA1 family multidrug resistance protein-like MFS transporter